MGLGLELDPDLDPDLDLDLGPGRRRWHGSGSGAGAGGKSGSGSRGRSGSGSGSSSRGPAIAYSQVLVIIYICAFQAQCGVCHVARGVATPSPHRPLVEKALSRCGCTCLGISAAKPRRLLLLCMLPRVPACLAVVIPQLPLLGLLSTLLSLLLLPHVPWPSNFLQQCSVCGQGRKGQYHTTISFCTHSTRLPLATLRVSVCVCARIWSS